MADHRKGAHRPKVGSWIPATGGESGWQIVGKTTLRLLGKLTGWDNPGREES